MHIKGLLQAECPPRSLEYEQATQAALSSWCFVPVGEDRGCTFGVLAHEQRRSEKERKRRQLGPPCLTKSFSFHCEEMAAMGKRELQ